jgi:uncharacterized protein
MTLPLMPKATAVWLLDNTTLTFEQIADFCGLHPLEVKGIADGEVAIGIVGLDPVANMQLTRDEIRRCEADSHGRLHVVKSAVPVPAARAKGARYTPVTKRQDRPDAIAWLLKFHPEIGDAQIQKLLGTTKATISAVRERAHWNSPNIKPRDPVGLGICTQNELDAAVQLAHKRKLARERREGKPAQRAGSPVGEPALQAKPTMAKIVEAPPPPPVAQIVTPVVPPAPAREHTVESVFGNAPSAPDNGPDQG